MTLIEHDYDISLKLTKSKFDEISGKEIAAKLYRPGRNNPINCMIVIPMDQGNVNTVPVFVDAWMWVNSKRAIVPVEADVTFQLLGLEGMIKEQDIVDFRKNEGLKISGVVNMDYTDLIKLDSNYFKI